MSEYNYEITIKCISPTEENIDEILEALGDTFRDYEGNQNLTIEYEGPDENNPLHKLTYTCVASNDIEALQNCIDYIHSDEGLIGQLIRSKRGNQ